MTNEVCYTDHLRSVNVSVTSSFMWTEKKKKKKRPVEALGNKPKPQQAVLLEVGKIQQHKRAPGCLKFCPKDPQYFEAT